MQVQQKNNLIIHTGNQKIPKFIYNVKAKFSNRIAIKEV